MPPRDRAGAFRSCLSLTEAQWLRSLLWKTRPGNCPPHLPQPHNTPCRYSVPRSRSGLADCSRIPVSWHLPSFRPYGLQFLSSRNVQDRLHGVSDPQNKAGHSRRKMSPASPPAYSSAARQYPGNPGLSQRLFRGRLPKQYGYSSCGSARLRPFFPDPHPEPLPFGYNFPAHVPCYHRG